MGFFSALFYEIMNQNNDYHNQDYHKREPTAEDYIHHGEIERDNYDDGKQNSIDECGELLESNEEEDERPC